MKIKKEHVVLAAAIILPFGLVALGLWKAYDLYKTKGKENEPKTDK